jgi:hypothetical protein
MKTSQKPLATASLNICAPTTAISGPLDQPLDSEPIENDAFHFKNDDVDITI